jgi:hypothetical protein
MKPKSDKTTALNKLTGKTLQQMSWDEIRNLKGQPISPEQVVKQLKQNKPTPSK